MCLENLKDYVIQNIDLLKDFVFQIVQALLRLLVVLQKLQLTHGNLKMSNCFLKMKETCYGPELQVVVSDPFFMIMFNRPKKDAEAVADMIHLLICGKPPASISQS